MQMCILFLAAACQSTTDTSLEQPQTIAHIPLADAKVDTPTPATIQRVAETPAIPAVTTPSDSDVPTDIWPRIRQGFQLDHQTARSRVRSEIAWYVKHPEYIARVINRAQPHLYYIVGELEKHGLPLEFALLPIIESAYDPFAYSHGRASGLWQFIPATARMQGITIDWWYDGRRDVIDSTQAAVRYLSHLHRRLDQDWLLALAAYNSGEGNVRSAIRRHKSTSPQFWPLKLPLETRSYVPRLLAISAIIANPEEYGIKLQSVANTRRWQEVGIGSQLDLAKASELAGISNRELYQLNAGYNQWSTHPEGPHRLLIPVGKVEGFLTGLTNLPPAQRMAWQRHRIKPGESLGSISQKYHTTVATIRSVNRITGSLIRAGDSLLIPMATKDHHYPMTAAARLKEDQEQWTVQFGSQPIRHRIVPGDSLWKISRQYGVSMRKIAKWNGIGTTTLLRPGRDLLIFGSGNSQAIRKVSYRVRKGESFSRIASKFNLSVGNIKQWNSTAASAKYLQPGDLLTLFVDVTKTHQ